MIETGEVTRALVVGGASGTLTRLILRPEKDWKAWLAQFVVGILAAVFLGGLAGHFLDAGPIGYASSAYVIGTAAEQFIRLLQSRVARSIEGQK